MTQSRDALDDLLALSERIGRDPALVQGPGGNTSLKADGRMIIKASGTWLADARQKPIMVPVELAPLLAAIEADDPSTETSERFVVAAENPSGLRPSIETTLHAVMPQRVVVHVHCVETIATAVREDAEAVLARRLSGIDYAFAPYARPGRPLTRAVREALRPGVDVVILGNHGLVVAADTVREAEELLGTVSGRLRVAPRPAPPADAAALARAAGASGYRPAADPESHGAATEPAAFLIATAASYYPDHVIFLGPAAVPLPPDGDPDAMAGLVGRPALPMLLVEGAGVLLQETATPGAAALARCLSDVARRIDPTARLRRLTAAEEGQLVNWDAEKYRQALDRRPS
jgi:rhamnose utilization protein RhaD (predicted bifunctional aldolase and dehydrogenase)